MWVLFPLVCVAVCGACGVDVWFVLWCAVCVELCWAVVCCCVVVVWLCLLIYVVVFGSFSLCVICCVAFSVLVLACLFGGASYGLDLLWFGWCLFVLVWVACVVVEFVVFALLCCVVLWCVVC